ncbi:Methyladenine glycosylase superfamily [Verrucomicrobiia bacterium DG1235]|nr:Methyladenine glycosylase superfamily [Verrucomicrobiae bacterium DG1235]
MKYHDTEWGVPERDSQKLFAKLLLDGAQAGLSWITILRKRDGYYRAFDGFDPEKIARYSDAKLDELMLNPEIVRNRLKIRSVRQNARAYLKLAEAGVSFSDYLWGFVGGETIVNRWKSSGDVPTTSKEAESMSRGLKKAGFSFVGPTIVYAFMQAVGMVDDHISTCFRHRG